MPVPKSEVFSMFAHAASAHQGHFIYMKTNMFPSVETAKQKALFSFRDLIHHHAQK